MRINVYAEEITNEVEVVEKNGFYGVRFFLKSHTDLHHVPNDDDRSAITFWGMSKNADLVMAYARAVAEFGDLRVFRDEAGNVG